MKTPTPLTDEQIADLFTQDRAASRLTKFVRTIEAARDAQWVEMLAGQEPVAWMYDWGADGETVRDWISGDYEEAHSQTHNIRPLYTHPQPDHLPDAGKMVQEPVAFFDPVARRLRQNPVFQVGVSVATWHGEIPLYTHPQPDDTALLRQALEALRLSAPCHNTGGTLRKAMDEAITALEARLNPKETT
jgi:hypothetical protein